MLLSLLFAGDAVIVIVLVVATSHPSFNEGFLPLPFTQSLLLRTGGDIMVVVVQIISVENGKSNASVNHE